jgi:lipoprotein-anchoring transpeptidase ErfK/SrfK
MRSPRQRPVSRAGKKNFRLLLIIFNTVTKTLGAMSSTRQLIRCSAVIALLSSTPACAQEMFTFVQPSRTQTVPQNGSPAPLQFDTALDNEDEHAQLSARLRRQIVGLPSLEPPGTIIIDTPNTLLYYILGNGKAIRYGIGVGRDGFTWSGVKRVARKAEWPDWYPPAQMILRQPYLARMVAGGPGNPLGARAIYIGGTDYRIHGTNEPTSIGKQVSSGCIRLTNDDVIDLYNRVTLGAKVIVLSM